MSFKFTKLQGTGNDFIFIEENEISDIGLDHQKIARKLCDRNFAIGADGVAFIKNRKILNDCSFFSWSFYNNDGSLAEMCGNAARCAVVYNHRKTNIVNCQFETMIGNLKGTIIKGEPQITYQLENNELEKRTLNINGNEYSGYFVNTGVPHFVIPVENIDTFDGEICTLIQRHPNFAPAQTNVTLLQYSKPSLTKSFERGVCHFTYSCGTGVIAAAKVIQKTKGLNQTQLKTPGGFLEVQLNNNIVSLKGSALCIFNGVLDSQFWRKND